MRTSQSADQFVASPWSRGQVPTLETLPRHPKRAAFHEHCHPSAPKALCQGANARGLTTRVSQAGRICAHAIADALSVRAADPLPMENICAKNEEDNEVSLYEPRSGPWQTNMQRRLPMP